MNEIKKYIDSFDKPTQVKLNQIRDAIVKLAPQATERICMGIPTYELNGKWFIHFAAYKKHIGFYPDPVTITAFKDQLKDYKTSKGTVQFPLNKDLPLKLINEMIEYRIKDMESK